MDPIHLGLFSLTCHEFQGAPICNFKLGPVDLDSPLVRKMIQPIFHGVAGLIIFGLPLYKCFVTKDAVKGFGLVGIGGLLIGIGGIALAFYKAGKPLFGIFTGEFILSILAPLLFLMTLAFAFGFRKDLGKE